MSSKMYCCDKCDYITEYKHSLMKHLNRKNPCIKIIKETTCELCNKTFKCPKSIYRHKKVCNLTSVIKDLKNEIASLKSSHPISSTITTNSHNINSNNTINQNNIICNFGSESMDKLTFEEKRQILLSAGRAHLEYLDLVHFNPRIPEFNNLFLTNLKSGICKISDKNKIKTTDYKTIESELVNNTADNIEKISYEFKEEYPDVKFREKVIKELLYLLQTVELEKEDRERRDNLLKELKYHLYDKSKELTKKS